MKMLLSGFVLAVSYNAMALSNSDICGLSVKSTAEKIRSIGAISTQLKAETIEYKGDVADIQQLDGIYQVTFSNGQKAKLRLNQFCQVISYSAK